MSDHPCLPFPAQLWSCSPLACSSFWNKNLFNLQFLFQQQEVLWEKYSGKDSLDHVPSNPLLCSRHQTIPSSGNSLLIHDFCARLSVTPCFSTGNAQSFIWDWIIPPSEPWMSRIWCPGHCWAWQAEGWWWQLRGIWAKFKPQLQEPDLLLNLTLLWAWHRFRNLQAALPTSVL